MSLGMTLTTLQQTVNLIRGLRGMAAVAMVAVGHGSGLLGSCWDSPGRGLPPICQFTGEIYLNPGVGRAV
jgi:hypothetical protein